MSRPASALALDPADFAFVYSGRPGCACGCRGKYTYSSKVADVAGGWRGYALEPHEINDRTVKTLLTRMNRLIAEGFPVDDDPEWVSVNAGGRVYTAYRMRDRA